MAYWQRNIRRVYAPVEDRMELRIIHESEKAYLVADPVDSSRQAWIPKSKSRTLKLGNDGMHFVYLPQWLGMKIREQLQGVQS